MSIDGTGPVAWTGEDLDALPVSAVVNSHILAARRLPGGAEGTWACTDGEVRTSHQLASTYAPLVVLPSPARGNGPGRVAYTYADLLALAVTAVVDARITARKVRRDGAEAWACSDGEVRTSGELLALDGPVRVLVLHTPTTDRLARGITGALPRSLDPKDTPVSETFAPVVSGPGHDAFCGLLDPHPRHRHEDDPYQVCDGVEKHRRTVDDLDRAHEGERATGDDGVLRIKGPYDLWYRLEADRSRPNVGVPSYVVWPPTASPPVPSAQDVAARAVAAFVHTSMGGSQESVPAPSPGDEALAADVVIALTAAGLLARSTAQEDA